MYKIITDVVNHTLYVWILYTMIPKLTLKQRKFWKHYQIHNNAAAAAKYAGSNGKNGNSLKVAGHLLLTSLNLSMPELLNAKGLTDEALAEPLSRGIKAQKPIVATWEGKITDKLWIDDHTNQLKAAELIGRMKGVFIDRHELTGKDGGDIILQINPAKGKRSPKTINLDDD